MAIIVGKAELILICLVTVAPQEVRAAFIGATAILMVAIGRLLTWKYLPVWRNASEIGHCPIWHRCAETQSWDRRRDVTLVSFFFPMPNDRVARHGNQAAFLHLLGHFVVVVRPSVAKIESYVARRFAQRSLNQIVFVGERARHANGASEYAGIFPCRVKRNDAA